MSLYAKKNGPQRVRFFCSIFPNDGLNLAEDLRLAAVDGVVGGILRHEPDLAAAAAQALLEELRLGDVRKKKVRDYSGGMQRRLALARALLAPSDAIALDEPFTGLDAENREAAMRAILRAAETKIVILSTHEELPIPVPCQIIEL